MPTRPATVVVPWEIPPQNRRDALRLSRWAAGLAAAIGVVVLVGWATDVRTLTRFTRDSVPAKINTGIVILALAAALALLGARAPRARRWAEAAGGFVLAIAVTVAIEYLAGARLIDELLGHDAATARNADPGRISVNATIAFALLAAAVLLARRHPSMSQSAAATGSVIGLAGFVGYASDVPNLYGFVHASEMALPTALALLALGVGLVFVQPLEGWVTALVRDSPGARELRRLLPVAVIVPSLLELLRLAGQRADLFDPELGVWLLVTTSIALLCASLVWSASRLDRTDARRREADAAWRAEQARFAGAVDAMLDPIVLARAVDGAGGGEIDLVVDYANPAAEADALVAGHELLGVHLLDRVPPEVRAELAPELARVLHTGSGLSRDGLTYGGFGSEEPNVVDVRAAAVPEGTVLTWRDVTAHAQLQRDAQRSADLLQRIFDNTSALISIKDLEGRYMLVNQALAELLGGLPSEFAGRTVLDVMPAETAAVVRRNDTAVLEHRRPVERTERLAFGDRTVQVRSVRFPLFDEHAEPYAIGAISTDVTELLNVQEELRALTDELERRVEERTQELARRTQELETANRELESFSYSVSHDLRAPLRAIDGFSRLVVEEHGEALPQEARDDLDRVCAAAQRMGMLIDELLKLSRLGRRPMQVVDVDLSELAGDLLDELKAGEDEPRPIDLDVEPGLRVQGDPTLLRTALQNLLANALKFTRHVERPHVWIGSEETDEGTAYFVRDNGAGFDMRYADRLFRPFERLHAEAEFAGTGVGLATVQRVIRRHGGRVWAEGEPGKGATFFFTLHPERGAVEAPEEVPAWTGS